LDGPDEWYYDQDTKMLYLIMPENEEANTCPDTDAAEDILRGRTLDNVLTLSHSSNVIVGNMTFWASNILASDDINSITYDSLNFKFPSSSHRMLGSEEFPTHTYLKGDDNKIINCTFEGAEGPAIEYKGGNMLIHNSEFRYNDWVGLGNWATVFGDDKDSPGEFSQNTMYRNGESVDVRNTGIYKNVFMNDIQGTCWGLIQNDGGSVHVQVQAQTGMVISHNWLHDSPKKGIRLDGGGEPKCHTKDTGCGTYMGFNVVWNSVDQKNVYAKGDNHTMTNNVAWDDDPDDNDCSLCFPPEHQGVPNNENSVLINNGATKFEGGGGLIENNYEADDVTKQMMDTANHDFRPIPGGAFITPDGGEIIGAYTDVESTETYWIPGRRLYKASYPIPHDGATVSAEREDVICRPAYLAKKHDFYFGENFDEVDSADKDSEAYQMTLHEEKNVFALPSLKQDKTYYWRIDAYTDGETHGERKHKGDVWSFSTE